MITLNRERATDEILHPMMRHFCTLILMLAALSLPARTFTPFRFALVTDTHAGSQENNEDLARTVKDINSQPEIAFVIVSGDVTEFGSYDELCTAKALLDELKVPYYALPGNHDSNWSESGTNDFLRIFGNETFGFAYQGYQFIGLASGPNMRMGPGQIPRENLTWFHEMLAHADTEKPIIYVNHYPMDAGLNNWYEVMDALRPYNVQLMLCGHGHCNRTMNFEGVPAAMCRSNLRAKEEYGGYTLVSVGADSVTLQERKASGETLAPWFITATTARTVWVNDPPRPDYRVNDNHPFVTEIWSLQEDSDIGGGMALFNNTLVYTNTAGEIKAVDAETGTARWSVPTGGKIYSTPVVCEERVWVASSDAYLYGVDVGSGKKLFTLKNEKAVVSSAACYGNKVMLAGGDGSCRAWDNAAGTLEWIFSQVKNFVVTRPLVKSGVLYFGSWGNEFYALDCETGLPRWIWNSGHSNRMLSPAQVVPVSAHGRIYLVSPDRYMTVLDEKSGEVVWRYNDPEQRVRESIGLSQDGNTVYAKTMEGRIVAVDATCPERRIKWISSGEDMGYELTPTPVVEQEGVVFAPTDKGLIYAYRASDGTFLWKYRISSGLITMILPAENGELYVSAMDGRLVKLKTD